MKILGIDPAMVNTGWCLVEFDPTKKGSHSYDLPWHQKDNKPEKHSYETLTQLGGGNFVTNKEKPPMVRMLNQKVFVTNLVNEHKPDLLVLESQLLYGKSKNPYGVAVQAMILSDHYHEKPREWEDNNHVCPGVVQFSPERLQSMAHFEKSTSGSTVVERYKNTNLKPRKGASHHEADAWFLAYHASRFWACYVDSIWSKDILSSKELSTFEKNNHDVYSSVLDLWWRNELVTGRYIST